MGTRIEIELTDEQEAWLRAQPNLALDDDERHHRPGMWIMEDVKGALPPEPVRVEIELPAPVVDILPSDPEFYEAGMTMTFTSAAVLNLVVAALKAAGR